VLVVASRVFGLLFVLTFASACGSASEGGPSAEEALDAVESAPPEQAASSPYDDIELPPFEPLPLSPPEIERPHWTPPPAAAPPQQAKNEEAEQQYAPLDALLDLSDRVPRGAPAAAEPRAVDLQRDTSEPQPAPTASEPGAIDRLKNQVHVDRRSQAIGPKGPRQGTRSETDAGIRVPLDEDVSLEGGVRVDERDEPGQEAPERKSTPRVGVEVRF
jgi:hypothetical protein